MLIIVLYSIYIYLEYLNIMILMILKYLTITISIYNVLIL